ncbi:MAG: hypothetical protein HQL13_02075 [Candidatus Omnitrophica bacterium]|nr:hypothetical protein [Candidatus Omnitrophota bacterium]
MRKSLTGYSKDQIKAIHAKSRRLNALLKKNHAKALFKMLLEHGPEIKELYAKKDKHYLIETGDLIVLCLELIKEAKESPDTILAKCYPRFHKKIDSLIASLGKI